MRLVSRCFATIVLASSILTSAVAQLPCGTWRRDLQPSGVDAPARAMIVHDDGSGPQLFVGGDFSFAGVHTTGAVARWDGHHWSDADSGIDGTVTSFAEIVQGGQAHLYAAGAGITQGNVREWTGHLWLPIATPRPGAPVNALCAFDDGTGTALYAAGSNLDYAADVEVMRWDGSSWTAVGGTIDDHVSALVVHDDGNGARLYCATASPTKTNAILHRLDGGAWTALTSPLPWEIHTLQSFDVGGGPMLWAGRYGSFGTGLSFDALLTWNGDATWTAHPEAGFQDVTTLEVLPIRGAPRLVAAGATQVPFLTAGSGIYGVRWFDGSSWRELGSGIDGYPRALAQFDEGAGPKLFVAGEHASAGGMGARGIARLDEGSWRALATPMLPSGDVWTFLQGRDPAEHELYVGGDLRSAGEARVNYIARLNSDGWTALPPGLMVRPHAMAWFDDGHGERLYVGGVNEANYYDMVGEDDVLARLAGNTWELVPGRPSQAVHALQVFDDGSGPALFVGSGFDASAQWPSDALHKFDGTTWSTLGGDVDGPVYSFAIHDDGAGRALFIGGNFATASGAFAHGVARWDGTSLTPVVGGLPSNTRGKITSLAVHDDGSGPKLYAAGTFRGGVHSNDWIGSVMRWDGANWSVVGNLAAFSFARVITSWNSGAGQVLIAAGRFATVPVIYTHSIAAFDGSSWQPIGFAPISDASDIFHTALTTFDDGTGTGPDLYIGGAFSHIDGLGAEHLAVLQGCAAPGVTFCAGDGTGSTCPCGNAGAPGHGCANSVNANGASLSSSGVAVVTNDSLVLTASGLPGGLSVFLQGSATRFDALGEPLFDGILCVGGMLRRLGVAPSVAGTASVPQPGQAALGLRGALPLDGGTRYYQAFYRNAAASFCPPASANWTNGIAIRWIP